MKTMSEALQQYRAAIARKQSLIERRRDVEAQRAQLASERTAIASAIERIRDEIQRATSLEEIRESRRLVSDLERDDAELSGLLGEPVIDPSLITAQVGAATREAEGHRRIVFTVKLAELVNSDDAARAKEFQTRLQACLSLSGADSPDLTPGPVEVVNAQRELLEWLDVHAA